MEKSNNRQSNASGYQNNNVNKGKNLTKVISYVIVTDVLIVMVLMNVLLMEQHAIIVVN